MKNLRVQAVRKLAVALGLRAHNTNAIAERPLQTGIGDGGIRTPIGAAFPMEHLCPEIAELPYFVAFRLLLRAQILMLILLASLPRIGKQIEHRLQC
jgi:hypothetical protein